MPFKIKYKKEDLSKILYCTLCDFPCQGFVLLYDSVPLNVELFEVGDFSSKEIKWRKIVYFVLMSVLIWEIMVFGPSILT